VDKDTLYLGWRLPDMQRGNRQARKYCEGKLVVRNIHELDADETLSGRERLLSRLHLKTVDGQWLPA